MTDTADFLGLSRQAEMLYSKGMSEEDLTKAKGRAVEDFQECQQRLAALNAKAGQTATVLEKVCEFLRNKDNDRFASGGLEEVLTGQTVELMADLHQTRGRLKGLRKTLQDLHIPISD